MKKLLMTVWTVGMLFSLVASAATGERESPFLREEVQGAVRYLSGGVGLEERDAMKAMAKDFNLKLVFAMASGQYLSQVKVVIKNAQGNTLLNTESHGPWFFVKLAEGDYEITATVDGQAKTRKVKIGKGEQIASFHWKS